MSENFLVKAKSTAQSLKEKITNFSEALGESDKEEIAKMFREKGEDKISEVFYGIDKFKSVFHEAGYDVGGINLSLGLPPDISISFKFLGSVDGEKRKEIEQKLSENKLAAIVLRSLFKASDYAEKIKVGELKLRTINIKLALIPPISVAFV